jgi:curli biogenesis system outer membrane secretion channel CsgG
MKKIILSILVIFISLNYSSAENITTNTKAIASGSSTKYQGVDERDKLDMFRIAILPFDITNQNIDKKIKSSEFQQGLNQAIIAQFTQSRKFRVSNRDANDQLIYDKEIRRIINSDTDNEKDKINKKIGADFILTGDILGLSINKKKTSYYGEDFTTWDVSVNVAYRVIELASMEVKWSNVITVQVPTNIANEYLDSNNENYSRVLNYLESQAGNVIADQIIGVIYPLQVFKVDDGDIYFNQGGNRVIKGSIYEVRQKGGVTVDDATGQHIVMDSKVLAKVRITDVMPKYSIGIVIDGSLSKIQKNSRAYLTR